jgi:hypothetical protein
VTWVEENGTKYVIVDSEEVENSTQPVHNSVHNQEDTSLLKIIERRDKEVKSLRKEIKRLTKQLAKCNKKSEGVYLSYIAELKHLQLKAPVNIDEDIIDIKPKKKKAKKKRKKDKK